jgi:hypothetical protein
MPLIAGTDRSTLAALLRDVSVLVDANTEDWADWQTIVIRLRRATKYAEGLRDELPEPDDEDDGE